MIVFPFSIDVPAPPANVRKPTPAVFRPATDIYALDDLVLKQRPNLTVKRGRNQ